MKKIIFWAFALLSLLICSCQEEKKEDVKSREEVLTYFTLADDLISSENINVMDFAPIYMTINTFKTSYSTYQTDYAATDTIISHLQRLASGDLSAAKSIIFGYKRLEGVYTAIDSLKKWEKTADTCEAIILNFKQQGAKVKVTLQWAYPSIPINISTSGKNIKMLIPDKVEFFIEKENAEKLQSTIIVKYKSDMEAAVVGLYADYGSYTLHNNLILSNSSIQMMGNLNKDGNTLIDFNNTTYGEDFLKHITTEASGEVSIKNNIYNMNILNRLLLVNEFSNTKELVTFKKEHPYENTEDYFLQLANTYNKCSKTDIFVPISKEKLCSIQKIPYCQANTWMLSFQFNWPDGSSDSMMSFDDDNSMSGILSKLIAFQDKVVSLFSE